MTSGFRSDESLPVKTGSLRTRMFDLLLNAEYISYSRFVIFSDFLIFNFRFYRQKFRRKYAKSVKFLEIKSMLTLRMFFSF